MLNLSKFKITHKGLYWGLIITFAILYLCVGFVSTLHSITFFGLANSLGLAILLGLTYEVGQASVLFSILTTKNKDTFLPWALMFLLTALQVTANVYASFKFMATSGSNDWTYWQKSILFGVQASNTEMYQVIISWIAGALLPIVALGMTALVAQNIRLMTKEAEENEKEKKGSVPDEEVETVIENEVKKRLDEREEKEHEFRVTMQNLLQKKEPAYVDIDESGIGGELTLDEQQKISDFIEEEKLMRELDEDIVNLSPIEAEAKEYDKQIDNALDEQLKLQETLKNINDDLKEEIKKRGRPPKQKETAVEPKKEQGLLQEEEIVSVPQEKPIRSRTIDPLKRKSTTQVIKEKDLDKIMKPSKGEEVIKLLESIDKVKTKESTFEPIKDEEISQESLLVPPELRTPYVDMGVEVLDAKAVPKQSQVKKN